MADPAAILDLAYQTAVASLERPLIGDAEIVQRVEFVCRNIQNRAGARLLLACLLAKMHRPEIDIRKPYTEIGDSDAYLGRTYDESYVESFVTKYGLPCNTTTAFLTPAWRNRNVTLTPEIDLVGRPRKLYEDVLRLLTNVHMGTVTAQELLVEVVRCLIVIRDEKRQRMDTLMTDLASVQGGAPLSADAIVTLVEQHLKLKKSSRLPVLIVAAAYQAAAECLGEYVLPLEAHNAADLQTGKLGDLEIALKDDAQLVTCYEMKAKKVTQNDIDHAVEKIAQSGQRIDNYIFITTDVIEDDVRKHAASIYERTHGIEMVVLDCVGFLRHFLHLFHRLRMDFLDVYQNLLLNEPESAVNQPLKEAFLTMRQAAESNSDL